MENQPAAVVSRWCVACYGIMSVKHTHGAPGSCELHRVLRREGEGQPEANEQCGFCILDTQGAGRRACSSGQRRVAFPFAVGDHVARSVIGPNQAARVLMFSGPFLGSQSLKAFPCADSPPICHCATSPDVGLREKLSRLFARLAAFDATCVPHELSSWCERFLRVQCTRCSWCCPLLHAWSAPGQTRCMHAARPIWRSCPPMREGGIHSRRSRRRGPNCHVTVQSFADSIAGHLRREPWVRRSFAPLSKELPRDPHASLLVSVVLALVE